MDTQHKARRSADTISSVILAYPRTAVGKNVKKLRLEGWLPVNVYGRGLDSQALQVKITDFKKVIKETGSSGYIALQIGDEVRQVYIKNFQLHPDSDIPMHADFHQIDTTMGSDDRAFAMQVLVKKPAGRHIYVKGSIALLSLVVLLSLGYGVYTQYADRVEAQKTANQLKISQQRFAVDSQKGAGIPVRLKIPSINVDAVIQRVGLTQQGAMGVPTNAVDAGWFDLGVRPGEKGSAVIAGHFDGKSGEKGIFANLHKITIGDKLYIEDDSGASRAFIVTGSRMYDPGYADEVFSPSDIAHLNLITCDGVWDNAQKSYSKRLVVFADVIP